MVMRKVDNNAVSQLLSTILLLFIAVIAMSVIYLNVISDGGPPDQKFVSVIGTVEGTNMIIEHHGGENIPITDIVLDITFLNESIHVNPETDLSAIERADGFWGLGERIIIPFPIENLTYDDYDNVIAKIIAIDEEENSITFIGNLNLNVVSDVRVNIDVNDTSPQLQQKVLFTISVTNPEGVVNAKNVTVYFKLPETFVYIGHFIESGSYNHLTGIWNIGDINLNQDSIDLLITATYNGTGPPTEFTQLCMLVDGSGSIRSEDWNIMRIGISEALKDATVFPHDGTVEFTVIQFAQNEAYLEINPTIITASNYNTIAQSIENLVQRKGGTPLACGFKLAADTIISSSEFDINHRQIINIVTDGMPNRDCVDTPGVYTGSDVTYDEGKVSAVEWRDYFLSICSTTEELDEIDCLAVGNLSGYYSSGPDIEWINSSIIWPQPGCIAPPFDAGRSWVREVNSWEDFFNATKEMFHIIFEGIWITVQIQETYPTDPNERNDRSQVLIVPEI
jgi:uncharacterized repeat protein (TIGR01451 family)